MASCFWRDPMSILPVNIGNSEEFTILGMCPGRCMEVTGSKSELRFLTLPEDDPTRRCPDITKARALLGWERRTLTQEWSGESLIFFKDKANSGCAAIENHIDEKKRSVLVS